MSIWNTNTSRPLVILQDIASKSISDLAWTPDGQTLFAASLDGGILAVKFEVGELGWVAKAEENDKALQKYGVSRKGMGISEDVDGLHLENNSKEGELQGPRSICVPDAQSLVLASRCDYSDQTRRIAPVGHATRRRLLRIE